MMFCRILMFLMFLMIPRVFASPAEAAPPLTRTNRMLFIFSSNTSNETRLILSEGIFSSLRERKHEYGVTIIELDSLADADPESADRRIRAILPSILEKDYGIIVVFSSSAVKYFLPYLEQTPEDTAVLFANVPTFDLRLREKHANTTAVIRTHDPISNLELGFHLFPETEDVYILLSRRRWPEAQDKEILEKFADKKTRFHFLALDNPDGETFESVFRTLDKAGKHSFLASYGWEGYLPGRANADKFWEELRKHYSGPVLNRRDRIGAPVLGGELVTIRDTGRLTAGILSRLFAGEQAKDIDPTVVSGQYTFNYAEVKRLALDSGRLPENSKIVNVPPSWFVRHAEQLEKTGWILSMLCAFLGGLAVYLGKYRRHARRVLAVQEVLPVRILIFDRTGRILFFHRAHGEKYGLPNKIYRNIRDIDGIDSASFLNAAEDIFITGKTSQLDYDFFGRRRSAVLSCADSSIFGTPAVIAVSTDAERHQRAGERASRDIERFSSTFDIMDDALFLAGEDDRMIRMNRAAELLSGYTDNEARGLAADAVCRSKKENGRTLFFARSGKEIPVEIRRTHLVGKNGLPLGELRIVLTLPDESNSDSGICKESELSDQSR